MKIKALIISLILLFMISLNAKASELPKEVRDYLTTQKNIPSIRYDGVIKYNNDVMYLPIFPANPVKVDNLQITKTYPENQNMNNFPDMILFNNNFGLLKIIKTDEDTLTIKNIPNLPPEIKTGLLPQDIMVPHGLVLPETLAGILGDVQVPLIGSARTTTFITGKKSAPLPNGKKTTVSKKYNIPSELKNKLFFVNNFQTEYLQVFSSTVTEPLYSLKTSGVMKDVKPALNGKYLLVATNNKKNIDVVDVKGEYIIKHIDLTAIPSEIIVDEVNKKAYIASLEDESLSVIDLETLKMTEKIQLVGSPYRLALSPDCTEIAYTDIKTSNIYILDLIHEYENKFITKYPNITKMILKDNVIYLIARTKPQLRVVYFDLLQDTKTAKTRWEKQREALQKKEENSNISNMADDITNEYDIPNDEELVNMKMYATSIKDIPVGQKPVDMINKGEKIFVLCAGDNTIYSYNMTDEGVLSEKLPIEGFSKALTPVPNSNLAIITNMSDYQYAVYDTVKNKTLDVLPVSEHINMITILERPNGN